MCDVLQFKRVASREQCRQASVAEEFLSRQFKLYFAFMREFNRAIWGL